MNKGIFTHTIMSYKIDAVTAYPAVSFVFIYPAVKFFPVLGFYLGIYSRLRYYRRSCFLNAVTVYPADYLR